MQNRRTKTMSRNRARITIMRPCFERMREVGQCNRYSSVVHTRPLPIRQIVRRAIVISKGQPREKRVS